MNKHQPLQREKRGQLHKTLAQRRGRLPASIPIPPCREEIPSSRNGVWVVVGGILLTAAVLVVAVFPSITDRFFLPAASNPPVPSIELPPHPTPPVLRSALNGGVVDSNKHVQSPLVVISVDNMLEGRPASGIDQPLWVFEFPTEATITRFLAVFDAEQDLSEIGPVRSARPYMIDLAQSLGAVLVHSGGSPDAIRELARHLPNRRSIDEFSQTPFFWRDPNRFGPHNLYTALDRLREHPLVQQLSPNLQPMVWLEDHSAEQEPKLLTIGYPEPYTARWAYNPETRHMERRSSNEQPERTRGNATIVADTVVIQFTDIKILDAIGRRSIRTLGQGEAMVVANGSMELAQWRREDPNGRTTLVDITGVPLAINPGRIWWTIVPKGTAVSFE